MVGSLSKWLTVYRDRSLCADDGDIIKVKALFTLVIFPSNSLMLLYKLFAWLFITFALDQGCDLLGKSAVDGIVVTEKEAEWMNEWIYLFYIKIDAQFSLSLTYWNA